MSHLNRDGNLLVNNWSLRKVPHEEEFFFGGGGLNCCSQILSLEKMSKFSMRSSDSRGIGWGFYVAKLKVHTK